MKNILEALEATAARLPSKVALADEETQMTFAQLQSAAARVGSALLARGARGGVCILMDRGPAAVAAMCGAVYAGCFYVVLDCELPPARLAQITSHLRPCALLCEAGREELARSILSEQISGSGEGTPGESSRQSGAAGKGEPPFVLRYERASSGEILPHALAVVREEQIDIDPLYVVFTSGSSGAPKGVAACHRSVIDYARALLSSLPFGEDCVFGNQSPLFYDAPLKELLPMLFCGASVWFLPRRCFLFPPLLLRFIEEHGINTVCFVASALAMVSSLGALEGGAPATLKNVLFGSEVMPPAQYNLWRAALPDARFFNLYGPTECTGMSCFCEVKGFVPEDRPIPIGRPFPNTGAFLLDSNMRRILPTEGMASAAGELYLRGTCVTLGYYADPARTSEAFVQNPLCRDTREVVYRTGDLCRYDEAGQLVFVSRADRQLKVQGRRIEPGEVEAAAARAPGVLASLCTLDSHGHLMLLYEGDAREEDLRAALAALLPRYLLPASLRRVERLPRKKNGKLDRGSVG